MTFISRGGWLAAPSSGPMNPRPVHVYGLAVHWSGGTLAPCTKHECANRVRAIQHHHMVTNKWADIGYSFLICQHGDIYVGRGTDHGPASQGTTAGNLHYWSACWLGGPHNTLTDPAAKAFDQLRTYLIQRGMGLAIRPHSYFVPTACPGKQMLDWIRLRRPFHSP